MLTVYVEHHPVKFSKYFGFDRSSLHQSFTFSSALWHYVPKTLIVTFINSFHKILTLSGFLGFTGTHLLQRFYPSCTHPSYFHAAALLHFEAVQITHAYHKSRSQFLHQRKTNKGKGNWRWTFISQDSVLWGKVEKCKVAVCWDEIHAEHLFANFYFLLFYFFLFTF